MDHSAHASWLERVGHHANKLLIAAIVAAVAAGLHPLPGVLAFTLPVALVGFVLFAWALMRRHDRRLCEQCVLDMPLDPAAKALRLRRRFWMAHTGSEPRFLIPYLVVLVASNLATSTVGRIVWAMIQLSMIYLVLAQSTHRSLQPWCPWCSQGGGGQEIDEVPPVLPNDRQNA